MSEIVPQHQYIARNKTFKNLSFSLGDSLIRKFCDKDKGLA